MSYCTWSNYGFGIRVEEEDVSPKDLLAFMRKYRPNFCDCDGAEELTEENIKETVRYEYEGDYYSNCGIASVLSDIIRDEKKIDLVACDDFDGNIYLLFVPSFPWTTISEEKKKIKETKDVIDLILPYWAELSDKGIEFDYYDVQNGG